MHSAFSENKRAEIPTTRSFPFFIERVDKKGALTEDYILNHSLKILNLLKDCNVTLRLVVNQVQSTMGLAEKTARPFLSYKAVLSKKTVNKTR